MISVKKHISIDYCIGVFLVIVPALFGMTEPHVVSVIFASGGVTILLNSLIMKFGTPFKKISPLYLHMKIDVLVGIFLLIAPSIFSYRQIISSGQYVLHVVIGFLLILYVGETRYRHMTSIAGSKPSLDVGFSH